MIGDAKRVALHDRRAQPPSEIQSPRFDPPLRVE